MEEHNNHEELMKKVSKQLKPIFDSSAQSIYLFLDDTHKICNNKFSKLLGYDSPEEWSNVEKSFTEAFVSDSSQDTLVSTYQKTMEDLTGSSIEIEWKKKDNNIINTKVIIVPFLFENHLFALHFISQ